MWALHCLSLGPRSQWSVLSLLCFLLFIIFCIFQDPQSSSYQPQLLHRIDKQGTQKLHFPVEWWHQWGSSCCVAEHYPDTWTVRLLLWFLKAKWRSEGGFKKAEREGFADTDRQFLPHMWGATEERAWLGLFWKHCSQRKVTWLID